MPFVSVPIEEIDESIKRPIVATVITDLMHLFGLPDKIPMVFKGSSPQAPYLTASMDYNYLDANHRFSADTYLTITEYEYEDNEFTLLNNNVYDDQPPIFSDQALGVALYPVYRSKKVTVTANITGSQSMVERWRAAIKRRTQLGMLNGIHTVDFHYPIPNLLMGLLFDVHTLREANVGYGDSLPDWLKAKFRPTAKVLRQANGGSPIFAIGETQTPIQGWFDFGTGAPKPVKDDEMSRWSLQFTYTFYADVPEVINARYEYIVHNQLLPERWIIRPPEMAKLDYIKKEGAYSEQSLNKFRYNASANDYVYTTRPGLPIPTFDDWVGDHPAEAYVSVVRAMVRVGGDPHRVMNYGKLGGWEIHPLCRAYMLDTRKDKTLWYDNVMVSMLYHGDQLMAMGELSLNDNFVLYTTETLDQRRRYHTVLTMLNDATVMTSACRTGLARNACFFKYWINTIYPGAAEHFGWDVDSCEIGSPDDTMNENEIDDIIKEITGYEIDRFWPIHGNYGIIARRAT